MRAVADAQQPRPPPALQPVDRDGQQLQIVPVVQLFDAVAQKRGDLDDIGAQGVEPSRLHRGKPVLADHIGALPIIAAVERHQHAAVVDPAQNLRWVGGMLGQAHPQYVDRRPQVERRQAGALAHGRMAAIRPDHQIGPHLDRPVGPVGAQPDDASVFLDQLGEFGFHQQLEARQPGTLFDEKVEKIPLRHQGDEFAAGRQTGEIGERDHLIADNPLQLTHLLMRPGEKGVEQPELMHHLQSRRVDRVAAEIAQEIAVFFQHRHRDPGARQQKAEHDAGGSAAGDDAGNAKRLTHHREKLRRCPHHNGWDPYVVADGSQG